MASIIILLSLQERTVSESGTLKNKSGPAILGCSNRDLKGSSKGDIEIDIDVDVDVLVLTLLILK